MEKKTIIAQVDYATEQIMKDISGNITSTIDVNLQDIKGNTKDIIDKLDDFDGLSSSLEDLKEFAKESRTLAKTISPIESQLANIQALVIEGVEKNGNKTSEVISSVKENLVYSQNVLTPLSQLADEKLDSVMSSLPKAVQESESKVIQTITDGVGAIHKTYAEGREEILCNIENISQELLKVKENIEFTKQRTEVIENRICDIEANIERIAQQNESQLNALKESIEKIQATLDIVVNLTTPFWKKWGK